MIDHAKIKNRKLLQLLVSWYRKAHRETIYKFTDITDLVAYIEGNSNLPRELIDSYGYCLSFGLIYEVANKLRFDLNKRTVYDTQSVINALAFSIDRCGLVENANSFEEWEIEISSNYNNIREFLPFAIADRMPFGDDVMARVFFELHGKIPFSRDFIFKNYEQIHKDKQFLVFPSFSLIQKRLVVFFSGNVGRKTYNRYSWYWDECEHWSSDVVYLFLNDINSNWYVGKEGAKDREVYSEIIIKVAQHFGIPLNHVFAVGGSMGGYAAILYATSMSLMGAIAINPQLCFKSALRYKEGSWEEKIRECGSNFRDLADEVFRYSNSPIIYLEQSQYEPDLVGFNEFLDALRRRNNLIILKKNCIDDHLTDKPSKRAIQLIIDYMEGMRDEGI